MLIIYLGQEIADREPYHILWNNCQSFVKKLRHIIQETVNSRIFRETSPYEGEGHYNDEQAMALVQAYAPIIEIDIKEGTVEFSLD